MQNVNGESSGRRFKSKSCLTAEPLYVQVSEEYFYI